jgi:hypothetical protein
MRTEKHLQAYLRANAKKHQISFFKLECVGRSGFPDVMLAHGGQCLFIELKSPSGTGRVSARQRLILDELTNQGMQTYVIDSREGADRLIAGLIDR